MIIYESTAEKFIDNCKNNTIKDVILEKIKLNGLNFGGPRELRSWEHSLPFMANVLDDNSIDKDINVAIEYKLDVTSNRVDFLVYGNDDNDNKNLVIIELKQWSESIRKANKPNFVFTNGGNGLNDYLHPSYQAIRYEYILKGFNQKIQDDKIDISSCSYLHNMNDVYKCVLSDTNVYPFVNETPVFYQGDEEKLRNFIRKYVKKGNRSLLYEVDCSNIRPSKEFSKMIIDALEGNSIFTLDDNQANAVSTIFYETLNAIECKKRRTIIIKGGPGSGKSVVAINAMGQLLKPEYRKNVCYCTTNFTPKTVFSEFLVNNDYKKSAIKNLFKTLASFSNAAEFDYDCVFLDEAHRAFKWKFGNGVKKDVDMIDRLFYASRVNVFFIDEDQVVTKDDYLTIDLIKQYARKYHSEIIEAEDLRLTSQFRCLGGENYISFINSFLGYNSNVKKYNKKLYDLKVFDSPSEMWKEIQEKQIDNPKSRLLSGYTRNWISKNSDKEYDFNMEDGKFKMKWNKNVNYSYINDDTQFDRIGCIHTIQGVDMDYAGVIIGKDLRYENGKLIFDKTYNAKTDTASGIRKANDYDAEVMIRNTYKVLLTRAIYGTYVYCEDEGLRNYLKSLIIEKKS